MRVVVIGATGNAGTAVLRALKDTPEVTEIIGVARRLPDTTVEPYSGCRWESVDVAAASTAEDVATELGEIFRGVDAVIHLAWLIQPNDDRELLRRVNVDGTERVAAAVAAAGVPHLVAASSVGVYSPDEARGTGGTPPLRDEDWPAGGIAPSHYSIDKADQERVLDRLVAEHPEITVTRLRPALTFQADAASAIQRYFLGTQLPVQALRAGKLPVMPVPKGLVVQAVHSDDVGRAYAAAVVKQAPGAFNICADDLLGPKELAEVVDHGRVIELPPAVVRAGLVAAHKSGMVPADEGWLDMGMQVPMMDNSRAKRELDWQPRHTAAEALSELLEGLIEGRGRATQVLRPRDPQDAPVPGTGEPAGRGADTGGGRSPDDGPEDLPEEFTKDLLNLYLSDHLTGATAGANRIARMANDFIDTPVYAELSTVAAEVRTEQAFLKQLIHDLGMKQMPYRQAVAWAGERVGRLKGNGRALSRSPMTMLLETELMRGAVQGKLGGWQTLREHAEDLNLNPEVFDGLIEASRRQIAAFDEIHAYARIRAFRDDRHIFWD